MPNITVIVEFETNEGSHAEFCAIMRDHARRTLQEEPGCLRFEVIQPVARDGSPIPDRLMVNELYADLDALTAHERNPRMPGLQARNAPLLKSRRLILAAALGERLEHEGLTPEQLNASNDG